MRLICGLLRLDGADADPAVVRAMAAAMIGQGLAPVLETRAVGEMALAVLDFAGGGAEAIVAETDGAWLAADVRPDRPTEAAQALDLPSHASSAQLALAAAQRWDMSIPDRLDGDFALALWNVEQKRLLLARDALGVRPLCYATIPGVAFLFASLPSGVIGSGLVSPRPDLVALAERLTHSPVETTGLADVEWLPAASAMVVTPAGPEKPRRAWQPDAAQVARFEGSVEEAQQRLGALMQEAVAARMADGAKVGVQLSGGLDSSAIAVLAARIVANQESALPAYSFVADPASGQVPEDETPYIEAVLAQEPNLVWSRFCIAALEAEGRANVDRLTASFAEPVLDEAYAAARADGYTRLLSGLGGDETASQQHERLHLRILASGRVGLVLREVRARAKRVGASPLRMGYRLLVAPCLPPGLKRLWGHKGGGVRPIAPARSLLAKAVVDRCRVFRRRGLDARPADRLERVVSGLMANRVNDLSLAAARQGLAFSFPMLDRRVVEFSLSLPPWLLVGDGHLRQPFRAAMAGVLPEAVRWRDSKFMVLPDLVPRLQAARSRIVALADRLRGDPVATEFLDFPAIDCALAELDEAADPRDRRIVDLARVLAVAANLAALRRERT